MATPAPSVFALPSDPMTAEMSPPASTIQSKTVSHVLLLAHVVEKATFLGVGGRFSIVGGLDGSRGGFISRGESRVPPERTKKHSLVGLCLL